MDFICPECRQNRLKITNSIVLPADSRSDEITLQTVICSHCGLRAIAVYEESRRGRLEMESWDHTGYRVSRDDYDLVTAELSHCPTPSRSACQCQVHQRLGKKDASGRWQGLSFVTVSEEFFMEIGEPPKIH